MQYFNIQLNIIFSHFTHHTELWACTLSNICTIGGSLVKNYMKYSVVYYGSRYLYILHRNLLLSTPPPTTIGRRYTVFDLNNFTLSLDLVMLLIRIESIRYIPKQRFVHQSQNLNPSPKVGTWNIFNLKWLFLIQVHQTKQNYKPI